MSIKIETSFNKNTNKYEIVLLVNIPNVQIKSDLNFRIFSLKNNQNLIIQDPTIYNSNYIFKLNQSLVNRNMYFIFSFDKEQFESIKELTFGLCHEGISWIINNITYINLFFVEKEKIVNFEDQKYKQELEKNINKDKVDILSNFSKETIKVNENTSIIKNQKKSHQKEKQNKADIKRKI
jgi:hypothetical protein